MGCTDDHIINVKFWGSRGMWPVSENPGLLLCFCNGWDLSPGDQGRRPVISASTTFPHYKLAARRPHCSARSQLPSSSAGLSRITSQPQQAFTQIVFKPGTPWAFQFLSLNFRMVPSLQCPKKSHFLKWMCFSGSCSPLTSDPAFMNVTLSVDFSTSWYCQLVTEKCELLSLCCQMKSMWEELCIF